MANSSHECPECSFVASKEDIYVSPETHRRVTAQPLYLGAYVRPGCSDHQHFYVFICKGCQLLVVDYPHGYTSDGNLFFVCYDCLAGSKTIFGKHAVLKIKEREIYQREKMEWSPKKADLGKIKLQDFTTVHWGGGLVILVRDGSETAQLLDRRNAICKTRSRIVFSILAVLILAFITIIWARVF